MSGQKTIEAVLLWAGMCFMIMSAFAYDEGFPWGPVFGVTTFGILLYGIYRPRPVVEGSEAGRTEALLTVAAFLLVLAVSVLALRLTDEHWSSRVIAVVLFGGFALAITVRGRRRRAVAVEEQAASERQNV